MIQRYWMDVGGRNVFWINRRFLAANDAIGPVEGVILAVAANWPSNK